MDYTKNDLELYDLVETRNGNQYILLWKNETILLNTSSAKFLRYESYDDLLYYDENEDYDIMKVKVFPVWTEVFKSTGMALDYRPKTIEWTWERTNEGVEITMKELNRMLGYRVKIVE